MPPNISRTRAEASCSPVAPSGRAPGVAAFAAACGPVLTSACAPNALTHPKPTQRARSVLPHLSERVRFVWAARSEDAHRAISCPTASLQKGAPLKLLAAQAGAPRGAPAG